ncbi:hypothetical protein DFH09DRAFT_1073206 [Mycena vulgaris]|nr:hypothetical protein DFH09DRAFT_1073206 [Mycena vulgaris]
MCLVPPLALADARASGKSRSTGATLRCVRRPRAFAFAGARKLFCVPATAVRLTPCVGAYGGFMALALARARYQRIATAHQTPSFTSRTRGPPQPLTPLRYFIQALLFFFEAFRYRPKPRNDLHGDSYDCVRACCPAAAITQHSSRRELQTYLRRSVRSVNGRGSRCPHILNAPDHILCILDRVTRPYDIITFDALLGQQKLTAAYSLLLKNLREGVVLRSSARPQSFTFAPRSEFVAISPDMRSGTPAVSDLIITEDFPMWSCKYG